MKKLFAGLCAFVLAMSMVGCGDDAAPKKKDDAAKKPPVKAPVKDADK